MSTIIILLIIIGVVAGTLWMIQSRGKRSRSHTQRVRHNPSPQEKPGAASKPGGLEKLRSNDLFWGVEIGQAGCEAAQSLLGRQYTFSEAPELPLRDCSSAMCTCQFKGLIDRRMKYRRTNTDRRQNIRFEKDKPDRRSRKDRRRGNWNDHTY